MNLKTDVKIISSILLLYYYLNIFYILSGKEAIKELKKFSGIQFDPKLIDKFIGILEN